MPSKTRIRGRWREIGSVRSRLQEMMDELMEGDRDSAAAVAVNGAIRYCRLVDHELSRMLVRLERG